MAVQIECRKKGPRTISEGRNKELACEILFPLSPIALML